VSVVRFAVVAYVLLAIGCVFYVLFTYAFAFGPRRSQERPKVLVAALKELGATLLMMPLYPLWWIIGSSYRSVHEGEGDARGGRNPVVLLHGFGMNRTNWVWLAPRLIARGLGPLYGTSYFSLQRTELSAKHLRDFVERVLAREDAQRVDIVAHSLGGVVARYYIERMGGATKVGRLVTIGSPHQGTLLGRVGMVPSARQLVAGSPFLCDLGQMREGVVYASIWSRADAVIVPPESSRIAPCGEDCVFDDLGHLSLLLSPRVASTIADKLVAA
jgi:triacylglycerol esterase/lipase EstA (alpha/beta hydrolase family)